MPTSPAQHQARIDSLMEQASKDLVHRRYFETEQACLEALRRAHAIRDYDRIARILLPLQEARRQKRDLAVESGHVALVDQQLPEGRQLVAGCYLVSPPRVGVDGRALREAADKKKVPVVVVVREPVTRDGLWPIVAVGPWTVRTKVKPPEPPAPGRVRKAAAAKGGKAKVATAKRPPLPATAPNEPVLPPPEWFIAANEALGDAGIATVDPESHPAVRVERLIELLAAHPDHEKLHQRLEEAARAAARDPRPIRRLAPIFADDLDGDVVGDTEAP